LLNSILKKAKNFVRRIKNTIRDSRANKYLREVWFDYRLVRRGLADSFETNQNTSVEYYQAFLRLFCNTRGFSNHLLSKNISKRNPPTPFPKTVGSLGVLSDQDIEEFNKTINQKGYCISKKKVASELCNELLSYALTQACYKHPLDSSPEKDRIRTVYDRKNPDAVCYSFKDEDLVSLPSIQKLITDPSILTVAQNYLKASPKIDLIVLRWSTAFSNIPSSNAAQLYHFDLDRPKWIKVFLYLTDVGPENGPHCFVVGTHKAGAIPKRILKKGYSRNGDNEIIAAFGSEKIAELTGPAGTIMFVDTRGIHKGKPLTSGDRLMLQLQFSNSLFGGSYPPIPWPKNAIPEFTKLSVERSEIFARFSGELNDQKA
jgi:hypothetical protein